MPTAVAESLLASMNGPIRNSMTQTARTVAVGPRARRATLSVLTVPARREQTMEVGPRETGLRAGRDCPGGALLLGKTVVVVSRAAADIRLRAAVSRCLQGARVRIVVLVRRKPQASVRRKFPANVVMKHPANVVTKHLANVVTKSHAQGNVPRIAYVLWRVPADIPGVNAIQANA